MHKRKIFSRKGGIVILLLTIELLMLVAVEWHYSHRKPVSLNFAQEDMIFESGEKGNYIDTSSSNKYIASEEFVLPRGLYRVTIEYDYSDPVVMAVTYVDERHDYNISGDIPGVNRNSSSCDFRVKYNDRPMQVRGRLRGDAGEESYLLIKSINISDSPVAVRNFVFQLFLIFCLADGVAILIFCRKNLKFKNGEWVIFRSLLVLIFIGSIPLMADYLLSSSHDLQFHLMRIEGLKAGLLSRTFPVKIQPDWLNGHGYAVSVFYGDVFLYFPAVLRIFGISVQSTYKSYVLLVNIATVFVAYYCFRKMSTQKTGVICAALYSLNIYRLTCLYTRAAVGEYTAMIFLPVILYGLWKVYTYSEDTKEHQYSWITIAAGFTGVLLSHMITCEIVTLFILMTCLLLWKSTFSRKNFKVLAKAAAAILILNIWFLVPVLDYMGSAVYVINNPNEYTAFRQDERAAFPAQLFMNVYAVTEGSKSTSNGVQKEMPLTLGTAFLMISAIWFVWGLGNYKGSNKDKKVTWLCVCYGIFSLICATYFFPYTRLAQIMPLLEFPERSLQYPWRFLSAAALFFTWLACLLFNNEGIGLEKKKLAAGAVIIVAIWQGLTFMSSILNESRPYRIYQAGNFTTCEVSGKEYLLLDSDVKDYVDGLTYDSADIEVDAWERYYNSITINLHNMTSELQKIEVPLLYYKGYVAETQNKGRLDITAGISGRARVDIPSGFSGTVTVRFREPWYWRICEAISLISALGIIIYLLYDRGKICLRKQ